MSTGDGEQRAHDPKTLRRRDALRKAAVGAGVTAAVWNAPRIEGLSMVPDYASAGTVMGTFHLMVKQIDCGGGGNIFADANCWGACASTDSCTPGVRFFDIGGEPVKVTGTGSADTGGDGNLTIDYSTMDPPWNMCSANAAMGVPGPGITGQDIVANGPGGSFNMVQIDQSPVNQGDRVDFTIVCT